MLDQKRERNQLPPRGVGALWRRRRVLREHGLDLQIWRQNAPAVEGPEVDARLGEVGAQVGDGVEEIRERNHEEEVGGGRGGRTGSGAAISG